MEDKLGDYIYLAIIVLTFVFSALKGVFKKKGEKKSETHQDDIPFEPVGYELIDDPDPDWDDYPGEEPAEPKPVIPFVEAISQMKPQPMVFHQPKSSMRVEEEGGRHEHFSRSKKAVEKLTDTAQEYEINDADAMRRAFVYSEIFNRKY